MVLKILLVLVTTTFKCQRYICVAYEYVEHGKKYIR